MILDLINPTSAILHEPMSKFDFTNPPTDPIQLAKDLTETMIQNKGLGLSANQVGLPYNVFVMTGEQVRAFFNPRIVDQSEETVLMVEGCLSYPGFFVKIRRPATCKIRYTQPNGETITEEFVGLSARIIQHEYDHLQGKTLYDRASKFHLEQAERKLKSKKRAVK